MALAEYRLRFGDAAKRTIGNFMTTFRDPRVAVLIPCFNEAVAIGEVVRAFQAQLPGARIYVYDNNSTDRTADIARGAGACVRFEGMKGKGQVVRRMFADVDADVCVLVDGDMTYDASAAPAMIRRLLDDGLDMVVASRVSDDQAAYRRGHEFGNRALTRLASLIFGADTFTDMLSGYRVFSRRFVKSFPAHAQGFETEVELAVHAMELRMPVAEMPSRYFPRPEGSHSKLNTYLDGWRILKTIGRLFKNGRPSDVFLVPVRNLFCYGHRALVASARHVPGYGFGSSISHSNPVFRHWVAGGNFSYLWACAGHGNARAARR